jgi:hypothetical protein
MGVTRRELLRGAGNFAGAVLLGDRLLLPGLTPTVGRSVGEFELIIKAGYRKFGVSKVRHRSGASVPLHSCG